MGLYFFFFFSWENDAFNNINETSVLMNARIMTKSIGGLDERTNALGNARRREVPGKEPLPSIDTASRGCSEE